MSSITPNNPSLKPETYSIEQLADFSDLPERTIRYYIHRGLVSRPEGAKRGSYYLLTHLEELLQVKKWVAAGMSLERVAALLRGDLLVSPSNPIVPAPTVITRRDIAVYGIGDGIELHIDATHCSLTPLMISRLLQTLETTLNTGDDALSTKE